MIDSKRQRMIIIFRESASDTEIRTERERELVIKSESVMLLSHGGHF
jgi:hypothetical protein